MKEKSIVVSFKPTILLIFTALIILTVAFTVTFTVKRMNILEDLLHSQEVEITVKDSLINSNQNYINKLESKVEDLYSEHYGTYLDVSKIFEEDDMWAAIEKDRVLRESLEEDTSLIVTPDETVTKLEGDTGFRSYMSYEAITNTRSTQYKLVHQAIVDENGILEINGRPLVAIGTGWGFEVGNIATVITDQGSYEIMVGDIKDDSDTDVSNKVTKNNGCVVEFIVDPDKMDTYVRLSGDMSSISIYKGFVLNIIGG